MPIIFKLIGCGGITPPEIKKDISGKIGLKNIEPIFESTLESSELSQIKIIANQVTLTDDNTVNVPSDKIIIIYIFTNNNEIRNKLLKFFRDESPPKLEDAEIKFNNVQSKISEETSENTVDESTSRNIDVQESKRPVLDDETVMKINEKTVELFNKPNFRALLNIWLNEPSIFGDFFSYINKGDIVNIDIPEESKDKMFENEIKYLIEELKINKNPDSLRDVLRKYNGVLNFAIRDILPGVE
jgi:hypothetical protein